MDDAQYHSDPEYKERMEARAAEDAAHVARAAAAAAAAAASSHNGQTPADIIAANALRHQIYDSIACPDCKKKAFLFGDINQKCPKCKLKSGGFRRKSKSQRRKKSKSQRRRKSIKRRH